MIAIDSKASCSQRIYFRQWLKINEETKASLNMCKLHNLLEGLFTPETFIECLIIP